MAEYLSLMDMFDGGGAGQSGDEFEGGGLLSMFANAIAKPYGYYDRQKEAEEERRRAAARRMAAMGRPGPQPAPQPGMTPGMSMGPFSPSFMPPQTGMEPMAPPMALQGGSNVAQYTMDRGFGYPQPPQPRMSVTGDPYEKELQMWLRMNGLI